MPLSRATALIAVVFIVLLSAGYAAADRHEAAAGESIPSGSR
jgi:hypothetical protein